MSTDTATPAALTPTAAAGHVLAHLTRRADNPVATAWASIMRDARGQGGPGTMRAWLTQHDGREVDALQATVHTSGDLTGVWEPGARTVATRATFATFDGSSRYYAGVVTVWSSPDAYVGYDTDMQTLIVYRAVAH